MEALVRGVGSLLLHLVVTGAVVAPLVWWRSRRTRQPVFGPSGRRRLVLAAMVYVAAMVLAGWPEAGPFADLDWNWQGKLLTLLFLTVLVLLWPGVTWRDVGVRMPRRHWWVPVLLIVGSAFALQRVMRPLGELQVTAETVAFQATLPGLDEEFFFRGFLLLLLDRALRPRQEVLGARFGWSGLITSVLFGLGHGLHLGAGLVLEVDPGAIITTGLLGACFLWLRVRWDSLWPAVLAHNGWNTAIVAANALE